MPIQGTTKNYSGRKVDLSIFPVATAAGSASQATIGTNARAIAGPSKVAQNFMRLLLTPLGSLRGDPGAGSNFLDHVRGGYIKFPIDLQQLFSIEAYRVTDYLRRTARPDAPKDEIIRSAILDKFSSSGGTILLSISLTTEEDSLYKFTLPVAWNI